MTSKHIIGLQLQLQVMYTHVQQRHRTWVSQLSPICNKILAL